MQKAAELTQRWIKMPELRESLIFYAELHSVSLGVRNAIQSSFTLHRRLCGSNLYRQRLGMQIREQHHCRENPC